MNNIKGKAKIILTDSNSTNIIEEHNIVTNAFKDLITILKNNAYPYEGKGIPYLYNTFYYPIHYMLNGFKGIPIDDVTFFGIRLFTEKLNEDPAKYLQIGKTLAYGNDSNTTSENQGAFNSFSSVQLKNEKEEVVGVRLVWDFPSESANGTFHTICLTPVRNRIGESLSNKIGMGSQSSYGSSIVNISMLKPIISFTKDGRMIYVNNATSSTENGDKIVVFNKKDVVLSVLGKFHKSDNEASYDFKDVFTDLHKVYQINNQYITFGKDLATQCYNIITFDSDFEVVEKKPVVPSNNLTFNFSKVAIAVPVGEDHMIFSTYNNSGYENLKYYKYKISTNEIIEISDLFTDKYSASNNNYSNNASVFLNNDGTTYATINYSRNNSNYNRKAIVEEIEGDIVVTPLDYSSRNFWSDQNFGTTGICIPLAGAYGGDYYLQYDWNTLFTINNLTNPITKTEANTMQIVYELTWGDQI